MNQEYLGMRMSIVSGGSIKITLPKTLVEKVWKRGDEKLIPVCYILIEGKVHIEDLEYLLKSSDYSDHIILAAKKDWMEYALKLKAKQERVLERRFIEGEINELFFLKRVEEIRDVFTKLNKTFRKTLTARGIRFNSKSNQMDISEIMLNISESEKDLKLSDILEDIKNFKDEVKTLESNLKKLKLGHKEKRISKSLYTNLKKNYESKLNSAKWRLLEIKNLIEIQ